MVSGLSCDFLDSFQIVWNNLHTFVYVVKSIFALFTYTWRNKFTHFVRKVFARQSLPTGKLRLFRALSFPKNNFLSTKSKEHLKSPFFKFFHKSNFFFFKILKFVHKFQEEFRQFVQKRSETPPIKHLKIWIVSTIPKYKTFQEKFQKIYKIPIFSRKKMFWKLEI